MAKNGIEKDLNSLSSEELIVLKKGIGGNVEDPAQFERVAEKLRPSTLEQLIKDAAPKDKLNVEPSFANKAIEGFEKVEGMGIEAAKTVGRKLLGGAIEVGEAVDSVTGAPTRAAVKSMQEGNFLEAPGAFVSQLGEPAGEAPTGKQIAAGAGFSTEETVKLPFVGKVSPAGIAGLGADILFDFTNLVPLGAIAKGAKAIRKAGPRALGELVVDGSKKALKAAEKFGPTQRASDIVQATFTAKQAPDFKEILQVADEIGIPKEILPAAAEFGKDSMITRALRSRAEGPLGQKLLENHTEVIKRTNSALRESVEKISGGEILSPEDAGNALKQFFGDATDKVFEDLTLNDNKLGSFIKERLGATNLNLSSIIEPERMAKWDEFISGAIRKQDRLIEEAISPALVQNARITKSALEKINPDMDINRFISQARQIGEEGFGKTPRIFGEAGPDPKALRELYFEAKELLHDGASKVLTDQEQTEMLLSNRLISDFFKDTKPIRRIIMNPDMPPEKIFNSIVMNIDSKKKSALESLLSPEQIGVLKGTYLEQMLNKSTNLEGDILFKTFHNKLAKNPKTGFVLEQAEIDELQKILRFGDRMGIPIMSTSGTGAANKFSDIARNITAQIGSDAIVDSLVRVARGGDAFESLKGGQKALQNTLQSIPLRRGQVEAGTKGLQSVSVQTQDEENPISRMLRIRRP